MGFTNAIPCSDEEFVSDGLFFPHFFQAIGNSGISVEITAVCEAVHTYIHNYMFAGLILGLRPANERRRYLVTTSLIGWVQSLESALCLPRFTVRLGYLTHCVRSLSSPLYYTSTFMFCYNINSTGVFHGGVIIFFQLFCPLMWGIHRRLVVSPTKGQRCAALVFVVILN